MKYTQVIDTLNNLLCSKEFEEIYKGFMKEDSIESLTFKQICLAFFVNGYVAGSQKRYKNEKITWARARKDTY